MQFKEFESDLRDKVSDFAQFYAKNMRDDPENFPSEMHVADWWEQFVMHVEDNMKIFHCHTRKGNKP